MEPVRLLKSSSSINAIFDRFVESMTKATDPRLVEAWKSINTASVPGTATNLFPFNLDPIAKVLIPERTPMQNEGMYGVKTGENGHSRQYRALTDANANLSSGFAPEATSLTDTSGVTGLGANVQSSYLSREKFFAKQLPMFGISQEEQDASGPMNAFAKLTIASLIVAKEMEEANMLGSSLVALGHVAAAVGTPSATGGVLTNAASPYYIVCIPVNYWGARYWKDANGVDLPNGSPAAGVTVTEGWPTVSTGITIPGSGVTAGSILATIGTNGLGIKGAFGYVWGIGVSSTALKFAAFTTAPQYLFTAAPSALALTLPTADGSLYGLDNQLLGWDGIVSQIVNDPDVPGQYIALTGGGLTAVSQGSGIGEFETMFSNIFDTRYLSPKFGLASSKTVQQIASKALGSQYPAYKFNIDQNEGDEPFAVGSIITSIKNQYAQTIVKLIDHPLLPDGKVIFYTDEIDYPAADVGKNLMLFCNDHFRQKIFAMTTDVAQPGPWGIRTYGAPVLHDPRACGMIDGII